MDSNKKFKLYIDNEYYSEFHYDEETKRYQSEFGYLAIKKFYEIISGKETRMKIIWI